MIEEPFGRSGAESRGATELFLTIFQYFPNLLILLGYRNPALANTALAKGLGGRLALVPQCRVPLETTCSQGLERHWCRFFYLAFAF